MKRLVTLTLTLTICGITVMVAAYSCQFYYSRYQDSISALDKLNSRIESFNNRLAKLEAHKSRELTPMHFWGLISTTDRPPDDYMSRCFLPSENRTNSFFEAADGKVSGIRPEFRLPAGSVTNSEFDIQFAGHLGVVADAWVSQAEPYQDLSAFEQFHVYCPNKTNTVRLIARARPDASVKMRFDIVVLCEK